LNSRTDGHLIESSERQSYSITCNPYYVTLSSSSSSWEDLIAEVQTLFALNLSDLTSNIRTIAMFVITDL